LLASGLFPLCGSADALRCGKNRIPRLPPLLRGARVRFLRHVLESDLLRRPEPAMCGIFGIVGGGPFDARELLGMSQALRHRGPDDEGFVVAGASKAVVYGGPQTPALVLASGLPYAPRS